MTTLTGLLTVAIPVTDQARSREMFERFGFTVSFDEELRPGFRWVELTPAGGGTPIAVIPCSDEVPAGIDTGIRLSTPDARAVRTELLALGLSVGELLEWDTAPPMFAFQDHDGNRIYVTQASW